MTPQVSVIVPMYATEAYIASCLDSILAQSFGDFEVLCVDDCSPDQSASVVEDYARRDRRVRLLRHERNLGLGGARNTAIRAARGDYLASVDSDDRVRPQFLSTAVAAAEAHDADVVCFGFDRVDSEGNVLSTSRPSPRLVESKNERVDVFGLTNPAFWNKLWRRSLYVDNDIWFPNHVNYQDLATTPRVYACAQKILLLDDILYEYLIRPDSISYTHSPKHIIDYLKVFEVLTDFFREKGLLADYSDDLDRALDRGMRFHSTNVMEDPEFDASERRQYLRHLLMMRMAFAHYGPLLQGASEQQLLTWLQRAPQPAELLQAAKPFELPISLLVKTFLRPKILERLLDSVGRYQQVRGVRFAEVIVGDDSPPHSIRKNRIAVQAVQDRYPDLLVSHVEMPENVGLSEGRNRMVDVAKSNTVLLCDDDFILDLTCDLESALHLFEEQRVAIMGGWLKNNYVPETKKHVYWGSHGKFIEQPEELLVYLDERSNCPDFIETDFVLNFFLARTEVLRELRWKPELKVEEHYDFFLRVYRSAHRVGFSRRLFVYHTHERPNNPEEYERKRFDPQAMFQSIHALGKKRRAVHRLRDDHFVLWVTDAEREVNREYRVRSQAPILGGRLAVHRLTPELQNSSFGYYDVPSVSADGTRVLYQSIPTLQRLPAEADWADLWVLDRKSGERRRIGRTQAWCHQQGAQLQWLPTGEIIYNVWSDSENRYEAEILDLEGGRRRIARPIAAIDPKGDFALSLNFARLYDYRPGYGYAMQPDPFERVAAPKDDGLFRVDLRSGAVDLVVSYADFSSFLRQEGFEEAAEKKLVLNHIQISPDSLHVFLLLRTESETPPFPTFSLVVNLETKETRRVFGFGSHYHWRDPKTLVISGSPSMTRAEAKKDLGAYEVDIETLQHERLAPDFLRGDGHCSYSPDRALLLYDSYSEKAFPYRKLQVYSFERGFGVDLGYFWSQPELTGPLSDCRCDLHPRWSRDGETITFDSTHEGFRAVYEIKVDDVISLLDQGPRPSEERDFRRSFLMRSETSTRSEKPPTTPWTNAVRRYTKTLVRQYFPEPAAKAIWFHGGHFLASVDATLQSRLKDTGHYRRLLKRRIDRVTSATRPTRRPNEGNES